MLNILLPTDFSQNALNAIRYCVKLYQEKTCIFYLVHTYTPSVYRVDYLLGSPGEIGLPDDYQYIANDHLEKLKKALETEFNNPKHMFIAHAAFNNLVDELKSMIPYGDIDFIVMGTQGATGAKEILLGSNTVHVIKKSKVPVLTIPADIEFHPLNAILFSTDYEIDYNLVELKYLLNLAKIHNATIHIMHITVPEGLTRAQENNRLGLKELMAENKHHFYDLPDQELIEAINSFQKEHQIQLLAMVRNKHTFLERLFIEPIIKKIGFHTAIPFLVFPYQT